MTKLLDTLFFLPYKHDTWGTAHLNSRDAYDSDDSWLNYEIERADRKVKTHANSIDLFYTLEVSILDFYPDRIKKATRRKELKKAIKDDLHIRSEKILEQMKSANYDGLGIGRYYRAFRPKQYEEKNWKETYQELEIRTHFTVSVRDSGIMD